MAIYGAMITEGLILNEPDIYYNKDKFDSGQINLCFITGHSGSGKSTMASKMSNQSIEHYQLDDVIANKMSFSMENLKEYGNLIYSFFSGIGKKYYYTPEDVKKGIVESYKGDYDIDIINDFVVYSMQYAKTYKQTKYIIEGIQLYLCIEPEKIRKYAVYIKGTSKLVSDFRASKRDSKSKHKFVFRFLSMQKSSVSLEKKIKKYRTYFSNLIKEDNNDIKENCTI